MSIRYRIDDQEGITYVLWDGFINANTFLTHAPKLVADSEWPTPWPLHLVDLRTATLDSSLNESTLKQVVDIYSFHPRVASLKIAIVAPHNSYDKAAQFGNLLSEYNLSLKVFQFMDLACLWLGTDEQKAETTFQQMRSHT